MGGRDQGGRDQAALMRQHGRNQNLPSPFGETMRQQRSAARFNLIAVVLFAAIPLCAPAQSWKPERPVEIIVVCAPGCGPDIMARVMQRTLHTNRYLDVPITIQNKAGGAGRIARTYLNQFEGNGHYLYHNDKGLLVAHAMGRSIYTDLTPIAILFGEYVAIAVKADSPIKSGRDLIERLKKDPAAHSVGLPVTIGSINHLALAGALKVSGIDVRKMRNVSFNSGAQAITALLGGHVDVVPTSVGLWEPHMKSGTVRMIAVSSTERQPGFFSSIPTWREQGVNSTTFMWRAMFGGKGMGAAQVAYWESILRRMTDTPEWKAEVAMRSGVTQFADATAVKQRMDAEYPDVHALVTDLELAKK
jgi:putative tricarboxylic transport membrane protein